MIRTEQGAPCVRQRHGDDGSSRAAAILALGLVAAACGGGDDDSGGGGGDATGDEEPARPRRAARSSTASRPRPTDGWCLPEAQLAIAGIMVARTIYDTLTRPNAEGEYEPWLAESVEPNDDYTEWTITLRDGVTFHDGTDLTAEVVKNNLDAYRGSYPAPEPAAVLVHVRQHRRASTWSTRMTVQVTTQASRGWRSPPTSTAAAGSASWPRPSSTTPRLRREPDRHRAVQARRVGAQPEVRGREEPRLLGHRRRGQPAARTSTRSSSGRSSRWSSGSTPSSRARSTPCTRATPRRSPTCGAWPSPARSTPTESIDFGEVSYVMLNASKPPFDNIKARQALAYAFDFDDYNAILGDGHPHPGHRAVRPRQHRLPRRHRLPDLRPRRGRAAGRRSTRRRPASRSRSRYTTTQAAGRRSSRRPVPSRSRPRPSA